MISDFLPSNHSTLRLGYIARVCCHHNKHMTFEKRPTPVRSCAILDGLTLELTSGRIPELEASGIAVFAILSRPSPGLLALELG